MSNYIQRSTHCIHTRVYKQTRYNPQPYHTTGKRRPPTNRVPKPRSSYAPRCQDVPPTKERSRHTKSKTIRHRRNHAKEPKKCLLRSPSRNIYRPSQQPTNYKSNPRYQRRHRRNASNLNTILRCRYDTTRRYERRLKTFNNGNTSMSNDIRHPRRYYIYARTTWLEGVLVVGEGCS